MTYLLRHTNKNFWNFDKVKLLISFLFFLFFISGLLNGFVNVSSKIFLPIIKSGNFFYEKFNLSYFFQNKRDLIEENNLLKSELEKWKTISLGYDIIKNENKILRGELGLKPEGKILTSSVVAKPPQVPLDTIFIDVGLEDGVALGDIVLSYERIMIGKISKISKNASVVSLNSFPKSILYGKVMRTLEDIELEGVGGANMSAKVPIDFDIQVFDKIYIERSSNYVVAIVGSIEEDKQSGSKTILFSLPVDVSKISNVFVLMDKLILPE